MNEETVARETEVPSEIEPAENSEKISENEKTFKNSEKTSENEKTFKASAGRVKKMFANIGTTRVKKEVLPIMQDKISNSIEKHVKKIEVPNDKRTIMLKDVVGEVDKERKECIFPKAPFRENLRKYILKIHGIGRVTNDALLKLQLLVEQDIEDICRDAQRCMNNGVRKTLFPQDIELASEMKKKKN